MSDSEKLQALRRRLSGLGSACLAYSGGVDSTFLACIAGDVLGEKFLAVTADSETYPSRERREAVELAASLGFRHEVIATSELGIPGFQANPPDRCYHCKKELFERLREVAGEHGLACLLDGQNADDVSDYRPGLRAAEELGVVSPLREAGLTKEEIRTLSRELGLPTWDKPAFACLASRFPYGRPITEEGLRRVDRAEEFLRELGVGQLRVRDHDGIARIEVAPKDIPKMAGNWRKQVIENLKGLGYMYVTLDLDGYRTGSMNLTLPAAGSPRTG
ncbi:MAG: ATP-dependent sacrificial sulfur transferase LarE [Planctomycetota bacterium]